MEVITDVVKVAHITDYTAIEIPYKNTNISLVIIVPKDYAKIRFRYRELISDALNKLNNSSSEKTVQLVMPKFNVTFKSNLVKHLQTIGIREVFTPGRADLTRMANVKKGDIWADKVMHQAVIKVNEKGTESTAVTAIIIETSLPLVDEKLVVNKPFIYVLRDRRTSTILFIGHVIDPTLTE